MNPKYTVWEGNVNWVNWAQNRINWQPYVDITPTSESIQRAPG
jgi:hypothetical protein